MTGKTAGTWSAMALGLPIVFGAMGPTPASADELSDLRANNQLLQQKLDQLAQIPSAGKLYPGGEKNPAAGQPAGAGSFPRSFLIPGTDTSIRIGGQVAVTAYYWLSGGPANTNTNLTSPGNNGQSPGAPLDIHGQKVGGFFTPAVNIQHSRGHLLSMSPRESQLQFETRTPTSWGEARTYISFDFNGPGGNGNQLIQTGGTHVSDSLTPRMLYAYGTLGGLLIGQANSNFRDADAETETIDFGGNVGASGVVRLAQVRYTMPLQNWFLGGSLSVSAEVPETNLETPAGQVQSDSSVNALALPGAVTVNPAKTLYPDMTIAYYVSRPWGHFDVAGVIRDQDFQDGKFISKEYVGWGLHVSGDFKPGWFGWTKDYFVWSLTGGQGIGRYVNGSTNASVATNWTGTTACAVQTTGCVGVAAANNVIARPIVTFGAQAGYQHHWSPQLRSNINFGINHADRSSNLLPPSRTATGSNKEVITAHLNLIWAPVSFVDIGVEYQWGHRVTTGNIKGDVNTVISRARIRF